MTPSKTISMPKGSKSYCEKCSGCIGLVRPILTPANKDINAWTDDKIYELKNEVLQLSKQGILLGDGLQVGLRNGKILQFDTDRIQHTKNIRKSLENNNTAFQTFLQEDLKMSKNEARKYGKLED